MISGMFVKRWGSLCLVALFGCAGQGATAATEDLVDRPNLVWFLTDDQDQVLGGSFPLTTQGTPMPKTKKLLQDEGAHAKNWYIHTPICSPSRAELLTGRYFHNIKEVGGQLWGMHVNYTFPTEQSFVRVLKEKGGYATGMFGKYLNQMPAEVPPGYDAWFANGGGEYMTPAFQVKGIDGLPDGQVQFTAAPSNYSTSVIGNYSMKWIRKVAKEGKPFFAYIAPKAAHEPFNPAPWYSNYWDPSWPSHEPRDSAWNSSAAVRADHHGNIASEHLISEQASKIITGVFKNRWRTLMSVDDLIADVVKLVEEELGVGHRTYFMFSSDHGFQLGQFNLLMDKRHVYEWDTKIHLLARGPGIPAGSSFEQPGTQVDIAPTLLGLAGIDAPSHMDGKSIAPFLLQSPDHVHQEPSPEPILMFLQESSRATHPVLASTRMHLQRLGDLAAYRKAWRTEVFIENYFVETNIKCVEGCPPSTAGYPSLDSSCMDLLANRDCFCTKKKEFFHEPSCYPTEDMHNNFIALRRLEQGENILFAEFQTGNLLESHIDFKNIDFVEHYDISKDEWQLMNLASDPSLEPKRAEYRKRLNEWLSCSGASCP